MLKKLKQDIHTVILAEEYNRSEFTYTKNELKSYNFMLIFATIKLIVLANRAKRKVEREYSPTGNRGQQCIQDYENYLQTTVTLI